MSPKRSYTQMSSGCRSIRPPTLWPPYHLRPVVLIRRYGTCARWKQGSAAPSPSA
ncbi:uncharacterized protein B0H18DRAFT_1024897 [Fomitopsis serialis]|uniref:uncharacterized protein n=1 Tax=Fomitopsis serialis TaxID=139415 RepID=UPI002008BCAB|nr:uncharacterized protein B0H18DRAFT_1024897 [Neoantrodia serialis]KAH9920325.1 hypothetical protein B0H18DRAFT_1024897 [Neoantrodia serialis]